jgi:hypothetical protein
VFDLSSEMMATTHLTSEKIQETGGYKVIAGYVARRLHESETNVLDVRGFQFLIARGAGFDMKEEPEYLLVSPYISLEGNKNGRTRTRLLSHVGS